MSSTVRIDFSRPIALFPLPAVSLYPHTAEWLVAFEPRYRQMVEDCLRARGEAPAAGSPPGSPPGSILSAAPIAMATYASRQWSGQRVGEPPLRPVVCVTKLIEHTALADGRHQVLLHGVSRARIESIAEPDGRRLYRLARLVPIDARPGPPRRLPGFNHMLSALLAQSQLRRVQRLETVREWLTRGSVPTEVIIEQLLPLLARGDDMRYQLLAEPSGRERARFVLSELAHLGQQLSRAVERTPETALRGVHLN
jgi:Lon protease-like protein